MIHIIVNITLVKAWKERYEDILYSVCDAKKLIFISHSTIFSFDVSVNPVISQTQRTTILFLCTAMSSTFCILLHLILTSKSDLFPDGFHKCLGIHLGMQGDKVIRSSLICLGMSGFCIVGWYVPTHVTYQDKVFLVWTTYFSEAKAILSVVVYSTIYIPSSFYGLGDKLLSPVTDWHALRLFCDYCSYSRKLFQHLNLFHSTAFCCIIHYTIGHEWVSYNERWFNSKRVYKSTILGLPLIVWFYSIQK